MSRWLLVLVSIQTALVLALLFKTFQLENLVDALNSRDGVNAVASTTEPIAATENDEWLNEGQLRSIVAEEMRLVVARLPVTQAAARNKSEETVVSAEEYQARLERTMSQLEYYIEQGEISPGEMAQLQVDIARLDEESRSHVLSLLVKAVSTSELDGEL